MQDFRRLRVWQAAQLLASRVIRGLPERASRRAPGLRSQAIRAAVSVSANIAEGCGRASRNELMQFIDIAIASLNELDAHLELAAAAGLVPPARHERRRTDIVVIRKMLQSLRRAVQHQAALEIDTARTNCPSARRRKAEQAR